MTGPESRLVSKEALSRLGGIQTGALWPPRSVAWRINRGPGGAADAGTAAGEALPATAMGHNGFTGTSVWIDPERERVYVLLTNRVHPEFRVGLDMNALRREFHRLAAGA
jgi:CubicO group peptidase (beta-lactamase class C family)